MPTLPSLALLSIALLAAPASARPAGQPQKTVVTSPAAKRMLLGRHMLSLQWVSWDRFGRADAVERDGTIYLKGEQRLNGDYVTVDGRVTRLDAKEFKFRGRIVTRVSHINGGEPCVREGDFTFAITGTRRYWRLQEMTNPCDPVTDYVDVYLRR